MINSGTSSFCKKVISMTLLGYPKIRRMVDLGREELKRLRF